MKMKTLFTTMTAILTVCIATAQPTITSADMPAEGAEFFVSSGNLFNELDFISTGAEYVWEYTSLESTGQTQRNFISVSDAPFSYQFLFNNPFDQEYVADFAENTEGFTVSEQLSFDDFYAFYKNDVNDYKIVGYGATINGIPIPAQTDPIDVVYEFPLEYEQTASNYSEWLVEIPELAAYKMKQTRSYEVDGWGNLYLPSGIFETLRIKMDYEITDSVYINALELGYELDRTYTEYQWLGIVASIPLLTVTETNGIITNISYRDQEIDPISVDEMGASDTPWSLYPNPTNDNVWLNGEWSENSRYELVNMNGQVVRSERIYSSQTLIEVDGLSAGMYVLRVTSPDKATQHIRLKVN